MDTRNGNIATPQEFEEMKKRWEGFRDIEYKPHPDKPYWKPMELEPTEKQLARKPPKVGRNEPCPCGSGKKFKKCCLNTLDSVERMKTLLNAKITPEDIEHYRDIDI
jgi:uncharacterized protein YecA (UPF0149 family)